MRSVGVLCLMGLIAAMGTAPAQTLKSNDPAEPPPKEEIKWPKQIQGKTLEQWVSEMRNSRDASTRDVAIRTLPLFGPDSTAAASPYLINAIKSDVDINVRLTAINTVPVIGFDAAHMDQGLDAMIAILNPINQAANHTRYETTLALGNCGPIAKKAIPMIIQYTLVDKTSWQNRKAAATALGQLGQPTVSKDPNAPKEGPDVQAIRGLIRSLQTDTSHLVRREALNSLMQLGPPIVEAAWKELRQALIFAMKDNDKSVSLWARVVFIRTEQDLIKPNDPNLTAIANLLLPKKGTKEDDKNAELATRQEAITALGFVGDEAKSRVPDLIAIVQSKNEEPIIIATALWALSQIPAETGKSLPVIDEMKAAPNQMIKSAADAAYKSLTAKPDPDKKKEPPPKS